MKKHAVTAGIMGSRANAIGEGTKRRIRTRTFHISGKLNGWCPATLRIYAPNKDAAIAEAHAHGMSVRECIELKQKPK